MCDDLHYPHLHVGQLGVTVFESHEQAVNFLLPAMKFLEEDPDIDKHILANFVVFILSELFCRIEATLNCIKTDGSVDYVSEVSNTVANFGEGVVRITAFNPRNVSSRILSPHIAPSLLSNSRFLLVFAWLKSYFRRLYQVRNALVAALAANTDAPSLVFYPSARTCSLHHRRGYAFCSCEGYPFALPG